MVEVSNRLFGFKQKPFYFFCWWTC